MSDDIYPKAVRGATTAAALILAGVVMTFACGPLAGGTHPFLIVTESNYPALRERAIESPWSEMKAAALRDFAGIEYDRVNAAMRTKAEMMRHVASTGALLYILDPDGRAAYVEKLRDTLLQWDDLYRHRNRDWSFAVPAGGAFFNSVLALDIIHGTLTSAERAEIESLLDRMAEWYWTERVGWPENREAVRGIWALYRGDRERIDRAKDAYKRALLGGMTEDGVFGEGAGYAGARLGGTFWAPGMNYRGQRDAKIAFMDVLEFTGEDTTLYSNPKLVAFYEWLYGYSSTPFRTVYVFGDTSPDRFYILDGLGTFRAHRFSDKAARYAAWNNRGSPPPGRLLNYVLMDRPLPQAEPAPSRIFPDGGAWVRDSEPTEMALAGAMWNASIAGGHSHKEVNALHLCAYGENILVNSGYAGASFRGAMGYTSDYFSDGEHGSGYIWVRSLEFTRDYARNRAISNNTVLIDEQDHVRKTGGGIVEGFTTPFLDYASGDSGSALPNGRHVRNFFLIHPQDGQNGYFLLIDEIEADRPEAAVSIALHPYSDAVTVTAEAREYEWRISPHRRMVSDVFLTIFLATPPARAALRPGLIEHFDGNSFPGRYLYSTYNTPESGRKNVVTVLFPHDTDDAKNRPFGTPRLHASSDPFTAVSRGHPLARIERVAAPGISGARVQLDGVADYALESEGEREVSHGSISFRARSVVYRKSGDELDFIFVRKGKAFSEEAGLSLVFEDPVTLFLKDGRGKIVSPGTTATIAYPGAGEIWLNDEPSFARKVSPGIFEMDIPAGSHVLEFR